MKIGVVTSSELIASWTNRENIPDVYAFSWKSALAGRRFDLIIVPVFDTEEWVESERERLDQFFNFIKTKLRPGGKIIQVM